jgi:hypothetical protein
MPTCYALLPLVHTFPFYLLSQQRKIFVLHQTRSDLSPVFSPISTISQNVTFELRQKTYPESAIWKLTDCNVLCSAKLTDTLWLLTYEDRKLRYWTNLYKKLTYNEILQKRPLRSTTCLRVRQGYCRMRFIPEVSVGYGTCYSSAILV